MLIGLTHYIFHRSTTAIGLTCYLQDLYTLDEARGKGVGRSLINGVYDEANLLGRQEYIGKPMKPTLLQ